MLTKVLKYEGDNKTFVWKHPEEDFATGTQLIVHESQEAIFIADGKVLDTFSAGRYTLETANLPLICSVMKLGTGTNAFHCELYFINKTEQLAIPWGTDSKIQYMDPTYNFPVQIGACGEMSLRVENSGKLLIKVVGTERQLTQAELMDKLRVFVMQHAKTLIAKYIVENGINVFELDLHLSDFSEYIQDVLKDEFIDYGINLVKFSVKTIVTPDEDRNFIRFKELHYRKVNDIQEAELQQRLDLIAQQTKSQQTIMEAEAMARKRQLEGYSYQDERAFDVAQDVAKNEAVGQIGNIGVGMGMMTGIGSTVGGKVGEIAAGAIGQAGVATSSLPKMNTRFCDQCGNTIPAGAAFCEICGTRIKADQKCANCGAELSERAIFCPICGTKRG